jgi:hypothetical protein
MSNDEAACYAASASHWVLPLSFSSLVLVPGRAVTSRYPNQEANAIANPELDGMETV